MSENFEKEVDQIVEQAQKLDEWKRKVIEDLKDQGEDTGNARIIVAGKFNGEIKAVDLTGYPKGEENERNSASLALSMQAFNAKEIRQELEEAVFNLSSEMFAAWALANLSTYTYPSILVEADLNIVQHNIKTLIQQERARGQEGA